MPARLFRRVRPEATPVLSPPPQGAPPVREEGSFAFGVCDACGWEGSRRRSRDGARRDSLAHHASCARSTWG